MAAEAESQAHQKRTEPSREEEDGKAKALPRLRRLELVRVAAARAVLCLAALYGFAKSRAGSRRPAVERVERVVRPVYAIFSDIPLAVLFFLDRKVDAMVQELDRKLPPSLKAALYQAYAVTEAARELFAKARRSSIASASRAAYVNKVEPAAKYLYLHYGPAAGRLAVSTWRLLKRMPPFPQAAKIAVQTAERYNSAVAGARFLPAIPTKLIVKFFSDPGVEVTHTE